MKRLLKPILRPVYNLGQKLLLRTLHPGFESVLQELRHLRRELEQSESHRMFAIDPVRCHRPFTHEEFTSATKGQARHRLGIPQDQLLIITLGTVTLAKGPLESLNALEQLHYWGVSPCLYFVGTIDPNIRPLLLDSVARLSLTDAVHFSDEKCSDSTYRDFLIAADCAIQIQTHNPGSFSGAFLDCISAGLPTVSNMDLAVAMNSPRFVATVPDQLSPYLIAEKLLALLEPRDSQGPSETDRARNAAEHQLTNYSPQILKLLLAS